MILYNSESVLAKPILSLSLSLLQNYRSAIRSGSQVAVMLLAHVIITQQ